MKKNDKNKNVENSAAELLMALDILEKEKGISKEIMIEAIENSLLTAYKNHYAPKGDGGRSDIAKTEAISTDNVRVSINQSTGEFEIYAELTVVESVTNPLMEISLEDARKQDPSYELGDLVRKNIDSKGFGRIATQNAKNVILQKIREEERKAIYNEFKVKEREVITGIIQRFNSRSISIDLGRTDAIMNDNEQVKTEEYKATERLKVYVLEVKDTPKGPRVLVSRTHPELVRRLFEAEVTELQDGTVEIKAISRDAGSRTKMAVWSNDPNVDPVGACVGIKGARVNAVVEELQGEKIDIINWDPEPAQLIENALSPAKVICVLADEEEKMAQVIVPDYQLSLAIGKAGQNAHLAARLTGYKIDIKSETQARESGLFEEIGYIEDYFEEDGDEDAYADDTVYDEEGYEGEYEEYTEEEPSEEE